MSQDLEKEAPNLNPSKVRLVFLDIDGVLNSMKTFILAGCWPHLNEDKEVSSGYFGGPKVKVLNIPTVKYVEGIDKYAVGLLNRLLISTNSHVVVSSSWREGLDIYQLRVVLEEMGLDPLRVIGKTSDTTAKRGEQIFHFLQGTGEKRSCGGSDFFVTEGRLIRSLSKVELNIDSYVILDDINQFLPDQMKNFVITDADEGLTLGDTLIAGSILTGKDFDVAKLQHGENHEGKIVLRI
jgi:hypothetical protein